MGKYIDITGQKFNRLTAIERLDNGKWRCQCECGNTINVVSTELRRGHTKSCGCYRRELWHNIRTKDLTGQVFTRLTVIKSIGQNKHRKTLWECVCSCGNIVIVPTGSLISGNTKSCGCYCRQRTSEARTTHGLSMTKAYYKMRNNWRRERENKAISNWTPDMDRAIRLLFPSCVLCGITDKEHMEQYNEHLHVDHVKPVSRGYGLKPGNATILCRSCNSSKFNKMPIELPVLDYSKICNSSLFFERVWSCYKM